MGSPQLLYPESSDELHLPEVRLSVQAPPAAGDVLSADQANEAELALRAKGFERLGVLAELYGLNARFLARMTGLTSVQCGGWVYSFGFGVRAGDREDDRYAKRLPGEESWWLSPVLVEETCQFATLHPRVARLIDQVGEDLIEEAKLAEFGADAEAVRQAFQGMVAQRRSLGLQYVQPRQRNGRHEAKRFIEVNRGRWREEVRLVFNQLKEANRVDTVPYAEICDQVLRALPPGGTIERGWLVLLTGEVVSDYAWIKFPNGVILDAAAFLFDDRFWPGAYRAVTPHEQEYRHYVVGEGQELPDAVVTLAQRLLSRAR